MGYKVSVTPLAMEDLREIITYIAQELCNPAAASRFLDAVSDCYEKLAVMPFLFETCRDDRLKEQGYRRAVIKRYVMLYRVAEEEQTVYVLRFFYGARDYEKLF